MISRCIFFLLAALMLAGCCTLGTDCMPTSGVPVSGAPAAWDGLGSDPTDNPQRTEQPPRKQARVKREIVLGPLDGAAPEETGKVQSKEQLERARAAEKDDEAKLKRKMIICSAC